MLWRHPRWIIRWAMRELRCMLEKCSRKPQGGKCGHYATRHILWMRIFSKILKSNGRLSPVRASWSHSLCSCSSTVFSSYILGHYPFPMHHLALCKVSHYPNLLTSYPVIEIWCIESLTDFSKSNIATRASWSSWTPSQLVLYFSNSWK